MATPADDYIAYFQDIAQVSPGFAAVLGGLAVFGLAVRFVLMIGRQL